MNTSTPLLLTLLYVVACHEPPASVPATVVEPPPVDVHWNAAPPTTTAPPDTGAQPLGRRTRRMSAEQLDRSLVTIFGDSWFVDGTVGTTYYRIDLLPFVAPLLGSADYLTEYRESADISTTFAKYMDNVAVNVCTRAVLDELYANKPARLFIARPNPATSEEDQTRAIRTTLRHLRLLLHGVYVGENETEPIARLEQLFRDTRAAEPFAGHPEGFAWITVCVAALTDPEFPLY